MKESNRFSERCTIFLCCSLFFIATNTFAQNNTTPGSANDKYVCLPCGRDCDKEVFNQPGVCTHCKMNRVIQSTVVFKTIAPGVICDSLNRMKDVIVLDVRTPEEFEGKAEENYGRLKNAINIPIQQLEGRLKELDAYKNKNIIVYCSHSHRSPGASYLLTQNGFTNVTNMSGGMSVLFDEKDTSCIQN